MNELGGWAELGISIDEILSVPSPTLYWDFEVSVCLGTWTWVCHLYHFPYPFTASMWSDSILGRCKAAPDLARIFHSEWEWHWGIRAGEGYGDICHQSLFKALARFSRGLDQSLSFRCPTPKKDGGKKALPSTYFLPQITPGQFILARPDLCWDVCIYLFPLCPAAS